MTIDLSKIDLQFRQITDLLFFSERKDTDLLIFKELLQKNIKEHSAYLWDKFKKSCEISWENGEDLWLHRFNILLSCTEPSFQSEIESFLQRRMTILVRVKRQLSLKHDIEYSQFLYYCKSKYERKDSLNKIKNYLVETSTSLSSEKITHIVKDLSPFVFKDMDDFVESIISQLSNYPMNYLLLCFLEKQGIKFNKKPLIDLAINLILERNQTEKNARTLFSILNDSDVLSAVKEHYTQLHKDKIISLIKECSSHLIEGNHLNNIKNLINLDSSIADDVSIIYVKKLLNRNIAHKRANADKIIRLIKVVPQISSKKVLACLAAKNKMSDIRYITKVFPELKKLSAFV